MKKIPTIFKRNPENMNEILNEPHPDCDWVFRGEGDATTKYDGTCVLIKDDKSFWKRRMIKKGKTAPKNFISVDTDPNTGKTFGWVPVDPNDPENKYHMEAYHENLPPGTYELVGPKIQGNPEKTNCHILVKHENATVQSDAPREYDSLKDWLKDKDIEGLVFHHPDGRMAKIKKSDFGFKR